MMNIETVNILIGGGLALVGGLAQSIYVAWANAREIRAKRLDSSVEYQRGLNKEFIQRKFQAAEIASRQHHLLIQYYQRLIVTLDKTTNDRDIHESNILMKSLAELEKEGKRVTELVNSLDSSAVALYFEFDLGDFFGLGPSFDTYENTLAIASSAGELQSFFEKMNEMGDENWTEDNEQEMDRRLELFFQSLAEYKLSILKVLATSVKSIDSMRSELRSHQLLHERSNNSHSITSLK